MPKFVPVTDSEKPKAEQSAFSKDMMIHRMFDDPHSVVKPHELQKRGFADGEVGWGNLNSYGSDEKDERAQILKHAEGSNKMVRNEKGLWVKAKAVDNGDGQSSSSQRGMGRGSGIPVLEKLRQEQEVQNNESEDDSKEFRKSERDVSESPQRRKEESFRRRDREDRTRSGSRDRKTSSRRNRSESRSPKRKERTRDDSRRRRSRDRNSRDRYDSRSRDYERKKINRDDSRENKRKRRSRSSSEPESRDKHRKKRDRSESEESLIVSKSGKKEEEVIPEKLSSSGRKNETSSASAVHIRATDHSHSPIDDDGDLSPSQLTAIQVINHFHEVYSEKSTKRLDHIAEMFQEKATIQSMKAINKIYLSGNDLIKSSFSRTQPQTIVTSKRIYIECPFFTEVNSTSSTTNSLVTYACDLHRAGTSPGLGDLSKDTVLLYECGHNHILRVWGMNDTAHLSQNEDLTEDMVYDSDIWKAIEKIIGEKWKQVIEENQIDLMLISHFHNYDKMEVWG
jgi:hypothetical protein